MLTARSRRGTYLMIATTASLLSVACGRLVVEDRVAPMQIPSTRSNTTTLNWENPIGGVEVADLASVQSSLAFQAYKPKNLGSPVAQLVSLSPPIIDRMIAFRYTSPSYGPVIVEEIKLDTTPEKFNADQEASLADMNATSTGSAYTEVVSIRNGREGFLSEDGKGHAYLLMWVESSGVVFLLRGLTTTKASIIEVANGL